MSFKSEIAPKGLQFNPSDFIISDKYATIISIVGVVILSNKKTPRGHDQVRENLLTIFNHPFII